MTDWTLDKICSLTTKPEVLNALHACRPGHPWNKTAKNPWRNAWFIASQQPSYVISCDATAWLEKQAKEEEIEQLSHDALRSEWHQRKYRAARRALLRAP
jgi:hypothetical protein